MHHSVNATRVGDVSGTSAVRDELSVTRQVAQRVRRSLLASAFGIRVSNNAGVVDVC
jgi:dUTPase